MMHYPLTREHIVATNAVYGLADAVARHGIGKKLMLVCDDNTWQAVGQPIVAQYESRFNFTIHSLGRHAHASRDVAETLAIEAVHCDGFLAVGSGTVNDVTKYAATISNKPYIAIATAASMNGYSSASASLLVHGIKQSHAACPPKAVLADLTVIAAAPQRLARAGLADTLCRSTVEMDMLMAHLLLGSPYPADAFAIMRRHEAELIVHSAALQENNVGYYKTLMLALLETGDQMAKTGSSAIASQGEHMIAHTLDSLHVDDLHDVLHGEMIAVTTLTMGQMQQRLMQTPFRIAPISRSDNDFMRVFGPHAGPMLAASYAGKRLSEEQAATLTATIARDWHSIHQSLTEIMVPPHDIERAFIQAGVPTQPAEIGISEKNYQQAVNHAFMVRDRFTFLDLAAMAETVGDA